MTEFHRHGIKYSPHPFPIDAVPTSGKFESGFFIPDVLDRTADVINPPMTEMPPWED